MALKWKHILAITMAALLLAGIASAELVEFQSCDGESPVSYPRSNPCLGDEVLPLATHWSTHSVKGRTHDS